MTEPLRPSAEAAIAIFRRWFLNRTDFVAVRAPWDKPSPVAGGDALDALLAAHVLGEDAPAAVIRYENRRGVGATKGRFRVGSYCPGPDDLTRWLCLDFDGTGHAEALTDPLAAARVACCAFEKAGLPVYLERSGGGHGWHVWAFFDPPIPAAKAQALGRAMAPKDAPLADGGVADALSARGIEVFPKQGKIAKKGYGNLVWLPWWREAAEGANLFYRVGADGAVAPYLPTEFAASREEDVDRLLAALPAAAAIPKTSSPSAPTAAEERPGSDPVWIEWRKAALAALALESVYGAWLTGKSSGQGWLECRDPSSSSGDQNPSAGVADGTGEAERGAFHSFHSGKTISVFDFLVERGEAADFRAAATLVAYAEKVIEERIEPVLSRGALGIYHGALKAWTKWFGARDGRPAKRLDQITPADWLDYRAWRVNNRQSKHGTKTTIGTRTLNCDLAALIRILNHAVIDGHIEKNPLAGTKKLREPTRPRRYLTKSELGLLIQHADLKFRPILLAAIYTGARKGELTVLRWRDIDFEAGKIALFRSKVGNCDHIDLHPALEAELQRVIEERKKETKKKPAADDHVFLSWHDTPWVEVRKSWILALKAAGLHGREGITFHSLRHSFATHFLEGGGSVTDLMTQLGHSHLETTQIYAASISGRRRATVMALDFGAPPTPPAPPPAPVPAAS